MRDLEDPVLWNLRAWVARWLNGGMTFVEVLGANVHEQFCRDSAQKNSMS